MPQLPLAVAIFALTVSHSLPASAYVCISGLASPCLCSLGRAQGSGDPRRAFNRAAVFSIRASNSDSSDSTENLAAKAKKAQEEAEKAAQRAAALKQSANGVREIESEAQKAAVLREFLVSNDPDNVTPTVVSKETSPPSAAETKRRYERKFFKVTLDKPMGLVLEENHESLRGVFVADVVADSNAAECSLEVVGCQLVSLRRASEVGGGEKGEAELDVMGHTLEDVITAIGAFTSPVTLQLYSGSASSLYGGWNAKANGEEVTVLTNRPKKQPKRLLVQND